MALMGFRESNRVRWVGVRLGHDGTQVAKSNSVTNATAIVYTVTAGKTLYLTLATFEVDASAANGIAYLFVRNGADVLQYRIYMVVMRAISQVVDSIPFNPPLEIPAGYDVCISASDAATYAAAFIHGWEE